MFFNGFGTPHAIGGEAQQSLAVLLDGFCRLTLQIQADDLGGTPVGSVGDQHHRAACQNLALKAYHDVDLARARDADRQREALSDFQLTVLRFISRG